LSFSPVSSISPLLAPASSVKKSEMRLYISAPSLSLSRARALSLLSLSLASLS
jgi:hypothetical protein